MNSNNRRSDTDSESLLDSLDSDTRAGLEEVIKENPDLLRDTLADLGYVPESNEQLIRNEAAASLSDKESEIADVVKTMGNPRTAGEVTELIVTDYSNVVEKYQSAKHRSWVSNQLNALVDKGIIGRFKQGHEVRFTATPEEAVKHWALHNDRFAETLDRSDVKAISDSTGMPNRIVKNAIEEITDTEQ